MPTSYHTRSRSESRSEGDARAPERSANHAQPGTACRGRTLFGTADVLGLVSAYCEPPVAFDTTSRAKQYAARMLTLRTVTRAAAAAVAQCTNQAAAALPRGDGTAVNVVLSIDPVRDAADARATCVVLGAALCRPWAEFLQGAVTDAPSLTIRVNTLTSDDQRRLHARTSAPGAHLSLDDATTPQSRCLALLPAMLQRPERHFVGLRKLALVDLPPRLETAALLAVASSPRAALLESLVCRASDVPDLHAPKLRHQQCDIGTLLPQFSHLTELVLVHARFDALPAAIAGLQQLSRLRTLTLGDVGSGFDSEDYLCRHALSHGQVRALGEALAPGLPQLREAHVGFHWGAVPEEQLNIVIGAFLEPFASRPTCAPLLETLSVHTVFAAMREHQGELTAAIARVAAVRPSLNVAIADQRVPDLRTLLSLEPRWLSTASELSVAHKWPVSPIEELCALGRAAPSLASLTLKLHTNADDDDGWHTRTVHQPPTWTPEVAALLADRGVFPNLRCLYLEGGNADDVTRKNAFVALAGPQWDDFDVPLPSEASLRIGSALLRCTRLTVLTSELALSGLHSLMETAASGAWSPPVVLSDEHEQLSAASTSQRPVTGTSWYGLQRLREVQLELQDDHGGRDAWNAARALLAPASASGSLMHLTLWLDVPRDQRAEAILSQCLSRFLPAVSAALRSITLAFDRSISSECATALCAAVAKHCVWLRDAPDREAFVDPVDDGFTPTDATNAPVWKVAVAAADAHIPLLAETQHSTERARLLADGFVPAPASIAES